MLIMFLTRRAWSCRPQLRRGNSSWINLNGLWEFEPGQAQQPPPFGRTLNGTILVPFPVESCLSGVGQTYQYMWYRLLFDTPHGFSLPRTLLHFGAVDWQTQVWVNQVPVGNHTGGFDRFQFEASGALHPTGNELLVFVYDPSDEGFQPNGKQRISAITNPGGDTYSPSSGIWQTVWLENVPQSYIAGLDLLADTRRLTLTVNVDGTALGVPFAFSVLDGGAPVLSGSGVTGQPLTAHVPSPKLWDPEHPFLYNLVVSVQDAGADSVESYFGMRSITLVSFRTAPLIFAVGHPLPLLSLSLLSSTSFSPDLLHCELG